ncbi:MAG: glycoside hydrolase family 3 N-terminal domain-containing protein [Pseudomonadota bacterium]
MPLAAIFDCEGPRLSDAERAFFKDVDPWGFIVFARHCASPDELRAHCDELRESVGREDAPILIDQEGGRVARAKGVGFPDHHPPAVFGALRRLDPKKAKQAARINAYLIARMVSDCGVNVNCVPMLDVPQPDADQVVLGDRVIALHQDTIAELGAEVIEGTLQGGALPVIKHLPGHGRTLCDSHYDLPVVSARREDLQTVDFAPFRALNDTALGMTAHVVYEAYDKERCATLSPIVINEVIRGEIGFDGLLMSDDLKMKALGGAFDSRLRDSLDAGCDIGLCCNFSMEEKLESVKGARALSGRAAERAETALAQLRQIDRDDRSSNYEDLAALLKPVIAV